MSRHPKGFGSVFWGLVLVALGSVLLLDNLGYPLPIWESVAQYWPVLIIAWGLVKLVDYYRLKGEKRRLFSGGEVAFLILVLMVGSAFTAAARIGTDLGFIGLLGDRLDLFDVIGENFDFSSRIETEAVSGGRIEIRNVYGSIDVEPGEGDSIIVVVEKTVRATSREEAERLEPYLYFTVSERDGTYVVDSNRDELDAFRRRRFKTSLSVQVPRASSVTIDNGYGPVRLSGLTGNQIVENKYGGVTLRDITGNVDINDGYGPVVAENISGDAAVTNKYGSVAVSGTGGSAMVDNKYGTVHISDVEGETQVVNKYALVSIENVRGGVRVVGQNNSVDLENVGEVDVQTTYKDIVVRNPAGAVAIANRHGDVRLLFETPPVNDVSVTGEYVDVRIQLPSDSEFSVDVQIRSGSFDSDFEGIERVSSGRERRAVGEVGSGGPRITVQTNRGDVRFVSRG